MVSNCTTATDSLKRKGVEPVFYLLKLPAESYLGKSPSCRRSVGKESKWARSWGGFSIGYCCERVIYEEFYQGPWWTPTGTAIESRGTRSPCCSMLTTTSSRWWCFQLWNPGGGMIFRLPRPRLLELIVRSNLVMYLYLFLMSRQIMIENISSQALLAYVLRLGLGGLRPIRRQPPMSTESANFHFIL